MPGLVYNPPDVKNREEYCPLNINTAAFGRGLAMLVVDSALCYG
jgi:hypothetical protein